MTCILGLLLQDKENYNLNSQHSNHSELRKHRLDLVFTYNVLYYFEVYRFQDKSRQIHTMLEDGTLLIFNKKSKKLITVILPYPKLINEYLSKLVDIDDQTLNIIIRCCELNKKYKVNDKLLKANELTEYLQKKNKIFS